MFPAKKRSYYVLISHETFALDSMVPVKGKNYKITPDEWATAGESVHGRQNLVTLEKLLKSSWWN